MSVISRVLIGAVLLLAACSHNQWGNRCVSDADCDDTQLVCWKGAEENLSGYCRYDSEVRCGPGTALQIVDGRPECVRDGPDAISCGLGTVDDGNGVCVLPAESPPDASVPHGSVPDAGLDAGVDAGDVDAGIDAGGVDAGVDAGDVDAGADAGVDSGV